jgi:hypothetical protein
VTFKLESMPSSTRDFEFTTDVSGSSSPFTLSDASPMQTYHYIVDGEYELTLPLAETTGYTAAVSCVGAASSTTSGVTTTFAVAGADVTCTITLTGMSTANVIMSSVLTRRNADELPTISCDDVVASTAAGTCQGSATFATTAIDSNPDAEPTTSCDYVDGALFDGGETTVTCKAIDSANQESKCFGALVLFAN